MTNEQWAELEPLAIAAVEAKRIRNAAELSLNLPDYPNFLRRVIEAEIAYEEKLREIINNDKRGSGLKKLQSRDEYLKEAWKDE